MSGYMKGKAGVLLFVLAFVLSGCGGGGGSDSESSSSSSTGFTTNAIEAEPTKENGEKIEEAVAMDPNQFTSSASAITKVSGTDSVNLSTLALQMVSATEPVVSAHAEDVYALNQTYSDTIQCGNGGTISIQASQSTTSATMNLKYDNCEYAGTYMDGSMESTVNYSGSYGAQLDSMTLKYTSDFATKYGSQEVTISSGSFFDIDYTDNSNFSIEMTMIVDSNGDKYGIKDANYVYSIDTDAITAQMYQTKGRIYIDSALSAYVDYDQSYDMSKTPFVYKNGVLQSGMAYYVMAGGKKARVQANNGTIQTHVDINGDGEYTGDELVE